MRRITVLFVLVAVIGIIGCSASKQLTAPQSTTPPAQIAVTISASSMYGATNLYVVDYGPQNNTILSSVTITGIPIAPAATVTVMSFGLNDNVVFMLEQMPVTCASNPGYMAGVSMVASTAGTTGYLDYPGTQIQVCGTAGVEQTMAMFTEKTGSFVKNY